MKLLNIDSAAPGIYRAKVFFDEDKVRVYVPGITQASNPITSENKLDLSTYLDNKEQYPIAQWCAYNKQSTMIQYLEDLMWVMFEGGDIKKPVILSYTFIEEGNNSSSGGDISNTEELPGTENETSAANNNPNNEEFSSETGSGQFTNPLPGHRVNSGANSDFGWRPDFGRNHYGVDMAASSGTAIVASDDGTISFAGWQNPNNHGEGWGLYVTINHGNGYTTLYAHCSKLNVSQGAIVKKGDVIGYVGSTGSSTGPHLHFEVKQNGSAIDPESLIPDIRS